MMESALFAKGEVAMAQLTPIVLIHGFPFDGSMWSAPAKALRALGYPVITPDLPGFGATAPFAQSHVTIEDYAEEIYKIIQQQAGGQAIVGGLSMGGYITMALLREHPEVVRAAMLIDTRPEPDTREARAGRLKAIEQVQAGGTGAICDGMLEKVLSAGASAALRQEIRAMMLRQSPAGVIAALQAMSRRQDSTELLPTLKIPVLLVVGDHDTLTPPAVAIAMHNHMPHAMLAQIANAGHLAALEQPQAVTSAMKTFLATM